MICFAMGETREGKTDASQGLATTLIRIFPAGPAGVSSRLADCFSGTTIMPFQDIVFLTEDASHDAAIDLINEEAFGPGRFVRAAERVREQGPHDRQLSVVARGDPPYYAPLGFKPTRPGALKMPGPFDTRRLLAVCYGETEATALEGEIRHRGHK